MPLLSLLTLFSATDLVLPVVAPAALAEAEDHTLLAAAPTAVVTITDAANDDHAAL